MCCNDKKQGCEQPENLKGAPQDCSPEQIRQCHGDDAGHPCTESTACEHPERLKGKPGECSPEQIRQCHGSEAEHRCTDS